MRSDDIQRWIGEHTVVALQEYSTLKKRWIYGIACFGAGAVVDTHWAVVAAVAVAVMGFHAIETRLYLLWEQLRVLNQSVQVSVEEQEKTRDMINKIRYAMLPKDADE